MATALGLSLYLLARRGQDTAPGQPPQARPQGPLVWIDLPDAARWGAITTFAETALEQGLCDSVLVTCETPPPARLPADVLWSVPPPGTPHGAQRFVTHWHPDVAVMVGGLLRPALVAQAQDAGVPFMLIEGQSPELLGGKRWYPGLMSGLLARFSTIHVQNDAALHDFRRAGAGATTLHRSAQLEETGWCLPCTEAERAALSRQLGTRPVWLGAAVPQDEETAVLQAHLTALRTTHRLLLVLCPADPTRAPALADTIRDTHGLTVARRLAEDDLPDDVAVYLADTDNEYGLWYRLAPVCYIGGTLGAAHNPAQRTPFEAASLGSAIVHGPFLQWFEPAFSQLRRAGATRIAPSGSDLGETVSDLLEPDRAARLAQAAWAVLGQTSDASARALADLGALLTAKSP